jgi:hypothetical protein
VRPRSDLYDPSQWPPDRLSRFQAFIQRGSARQCWPWLGGRAGKGAGRYSWRTPGGGASVYAGRFAYVLARGPLSPDLEVIHRCGNAVCCNPSHMLVGQPKDRLSLLSPRGLANAGERHPAAKLSAERVRELIALKHAHPELTSRELATRFGLRSPSVVSAILSGRLWKSVDVPRLKLRKGPLPRNG